LSAWLQVAVMVLAGASVASTLAQPASAPAPDSSAAAGDSASDDEQFDILEFVVDGNSVLPPLEIERAVYRFLGEKKRFKDVEGARKSLEDAYQSLGYQTVFVDVPEQKIVDGVVHLRVTEGTVRQSRVVGSRYFSLGEIRTRASELAPGNVPDFNQVQGELAQLNRTPDLQVAPVLRAGATPGTVDVDLSVKDQLPLHGDVEFNDYASPFTSRERATASLRYDNLWQRQHSLGLTYQTAPQKHDEVDVLYGTYLWRFAESADVVTLYGIRSNSRIAIVGNATVLGNARIVGARWIKPLGSFPGTFHSLTAGIDWKDFGQTNISAQTGEPISYPPIDYVPLSAAYSVTYVAVDDFVQGSLSVSTAPRGLFGNTDEEFRGRRVVASAGYFAWKYDLSAEHWVASSWSAFGRVEGQWTATPLIPNEQFTVGGATSVRGYRESELSGDVGTRGTLELRFYPTGKPAFDRLRSVSLALFLDAASIRLVEPLYPQIPAQEIASTGLSLRATGWYGLRFAADAAYVLRDGGKGVNGLVSARGDKRLSFSLGYGF